MVLGSKVGACHISSWLIAVLGMKSQPRSQPLAAYQVFAFCLDQTGRVALGVAAARVMIVMASRRARMGECFLRVKDNYSPLGFVRGVLIFTGVPKLGEPSAFQVKRCMRGIRLLPQPWAWSGLA